MAQQDDEELNLNSSSRLITDPQKDGPDLVEIPCCGCLSVQFYQPYFDVDTQDVVNRLAQSVFFCKREELFLNSINEKPDAYGPVWVSSCAHNVLISNDFINLIFIFSDCHNPHLRHSRHFSNEQFLCFLDGWEVMVSIPFK